MVVFWQLKAVSFLRLLRQSLKYLFKTHESIESWLMSGRLFFERQHVLKVGDVEFEDLELEEVEFAQEGLT